MFNLSKNGTNVKTELVAGLTTFMTMAYILAVNPNILSDAGIPRGGVFVATALAATIGTLLMAFLANYPFALAPGMGLNAFLAYGVVLGMGYSWQFALLAVFVEGLVFLALSLTPMREGIFNAIPMSLKKAVSAGIGLFICFIALQNAKIVVDNGATLVDILEFRSVPFHTQGICAILALAGILITGVMLAMKLKGAILFGILVTWILGMGAQGLDVYRPDSDGDGIPDAQERVWKTNPFDPEDALSDLDNDGFCNLAEAMAGTDAREETSLPEGTESDYLNREAPPKFDKYFSLYPRFTFAGVKDSFVEFKKTFGAVFHPDGWTHTAKDGVVTTGKALALSLHFFTIMFAFFFVDLFDTLGTLIGVSMKGDMLDKDGRLPRISGALCADAVATSVGAVLGTSTTTTYVESASGVAAGGRTGLTALSTAALFALSILFAPVFLAIPGFATAPALVIVGYMMLSSVADIEWSDAGESIPAFIALAWMPFTYSISDGIMFGIIAYTLINLLSGKAKRVHWLMIALTAVFIVKLALI